MEFDISPLMKDFEGNEVVFTEEGSEELKKLSYKKCLLNFCGSAMPQETISGEEKILRFKLGLKIADCTDKVDLTLDEVKKLKDLSRLYGSTLTAGRIAQLLEPAEFEAKKEKS